jgi:hypothetical protein
MGKKAMAGMKAQTHEARNGGSIEKNLHFLNLVSTDMLVWYGQRSIA